MVFLLFPSSTADYYSSKTLWFEVLVTNSSGVMPRNLKFYFTTYRVLGKMADRILFIFSWSLGSSKYSGADCNPKTVSLATILFKGVVMDNLFLIFWDPFSLFVIFKLLERLVWILIGEGLYSRLTLSFSSIYFWKSKLWDYFTKSSFKISLHELLDIFIN